MTENLLVVAEQAVHWNQVYIIRLQTAMSADLEMQFNSDLRHFNLGLEIRSNFCHTRCHWTTLHDLLVACCNQAYSVDWHWGWLDWISATSFKHLRAGSVAGVVIIWAVILNIVNFYLIISSWTQNNQDYFRLLYHL